MSTGTKHQWPRRPQSWFNLSNELELSNELKRDLPAHQASALASAKPLRRSAQGTRMNLQRAFAHNAEPSLEKSASWIVAFSAMFLHPLSAASHNLLNL